ncbi:MAG: hypothetical protein WKF97_09995 [Chitinophagaceae bacterium]
MKPKNIEQRNKIIIRFAGFYTASIILIIIIFSAFSDKSLPVQQDRTVSFVEKKADTSTSFEQEQVLLETGLLYSPLKNLRQLDERYAGLLKDAADLPKLETTRKIITANQQEYKNRIDSIERGAVKYKSDINAKFVEQIVAFSRLALENRNDWYKLQAAAPQQSTVAEQQPERQVNDTQVSDNQAADKQAIARWQREVLKKNERVSDLESQLKSLQRENRSLRLALTDN